jgi:hypothetical protein
MPNGASSSNSRNVVGPSYSIEYDRRAHNHAIIAGLREWFSVNANVPADRAIRFADCVLVGRSYGTKSRDILNYIPNDVAQVIRVLDIDTGHADITHQYCSPVLGNEAVSSQPGHSRHSSHCPVVDRRQRIFSGINQLVNNVHRIIMNVWEFLGGFWILCTYLIPDCIFLGGQFQISSVLMASL